MKHKILRRDLKVGNIVPIFLNYKNQTNYRGHAILLKRLSDREPSKEDREYEFAEIGGINTERKKDKVQVLYNWQWWRILFTEGPEKGFETAVRIAYYQRTFWQKDYEDFLTENMKES